MSSFERQTVFISNLYKATSGEVSRSVTEDLNDVSQAVTEVVSKMGRHVSEQKVKWDSK